jgi:hypothetical protein
MREFEAARISMRSLLDQDFIGGRLHAEMSSNLQSDNHERPERIA